MTKAEIRAEQIRFECTNRLIVHPRAGIKDYEDSCRIGAEWADAHPINPWRKVSEELPEEKTYSENTLQGKREWKESEPVLVIDNHLQKSVDSLKNGEWFNLKRRGKDCDGFDITYVYWMPIPELPIEKE